MSLIFIHGIGQQGFTEAQLKKRWIDALIAHGIDAAALAAAKPVMAYYGTALKQWTDGGRTLATTMGGPVEDQELSFLSAALDEIASYKAIQENEIEAEVVSQAVEAGAAAIEQSTWLGRRAVAIVELLERLSPLRGKLVIKVLRQAYVYLSNPGCRSEIDDLVSPHIGKGEKVIVSHSLGTVIAFLLLRAAAKRGDDLRVPLLVTLGSPLGIAEVQRWVGGNYAVPPNVSVWRNYFDPGDPVTLGRPLSSSFSRNISDTRVNNITGNAHGIDGYLNSAQLVADLAATLKRADETGF